MAIVHKLYDGTNTVDLTTTTGFQSMVDYVPQTSPIPGDGSIPPYIEELIPVTIKGTSDDNFAAELQTFHTLQREAAQYWVDPQATTPVYYHQKLDDETGERRALVKSLSLQFANEAGDWFTEYPANTAGKKARLVVERHPYWERINTRAFPNTTPTAAAAVAYDYTSTADVVGDVEARINALTIRSTQNLPNEISRVWMGIRSAGKHGATGVTAFVPVWECEDGANNGDASVYDDGGGTEPNLASPGGGRGDYVVVDEGFGGSSLDWDADYSLVFSTNAALAGYTTKSDSYGRFLWLIRAKVTAGEWSIYARSGYSTARAYRDPVSIDGTSWDFYSLGVWDVPSHNLRAMDTTGLVHNERIYVYGKRISGSGDLYLDCICTVPVDEGFLHIWEGDGAQAAASAYDMAFGQGPSEHLQALTIFDATAGSDNTAEDIDPFEAENFRLPPGDGRIICVYARDSSSVLTDQVEFADTGGIASTYTERWTSLRGSE